MGGNALKNTPTRRYSAAEYHVTAPKLRQEISDLLGTRVEIIPSYAQKPSFGDLDLLVQSERLPQNWKQQLIAYFKLSDKMYVTNGDVFSFAFQELQVDVITTPAREMDTSMQYFAYNDLGNLMGRMMHKLGIKYGHRGLSVIVRSPCQGNHVLEEIMLEVERPYEVSCEILGLDSSFKFETLDDIFKFTASAKYFDPDIYLLHNRNHANRVRDQKRKTYGGFLDWIQEHDVKGNFCFGEKHDRGGYNIREPFYTEIVLARWPWVKPVVDGIIKAHEIDMQFKEVYNGEIVQSLTGFTGKRLGAFMSLMKEHINLATKLRWIAHPSDATRFIHAAWIQNGGERFLTELR